jgi:hypothetical protein
MALLLFTRARIPLRTDDSYSPQSMSSNIHNHPRDDDSLADRLPMQRI